jgi:hypothetical protein
MKNAVFWNVRPWALVRIDVSKERIAFHHQGGKIRGAENNVSSNKQPKHVIFFLNSVARLLVTVNAVRSSPILVTLMIEATCFSETSVLTRATGRNIPEDGILHCHILQHAIELASHPIVQSSAIPRFWMH